MLCSLRSDSTHLPLCYCCQSHQCQGCFQCVTTYPSLNILSRLFSQSHIKICIYNATKTFCYKKSNSIGTLIRESMFNLQALQFHKLCGIVINQSLYGKMYSSLNRYYFPVRKMNTFVYQTQIIKLSSPRHDL